MLREHSHDAVYLLYFLVVFGTKIHSAVTLFLENQVAYKKLQLGI